MPITQVLAYVNWGRWIGSCVAPGCFDAVELAPGQETMACIRGHVAPVRWPGNAAAIMGALEARIDESKRNWFPSGHPMAEAGGYPTDQSPADLERERLAHEAGEPRETKRDRAVALLRELGLQVGPDGTVLGSL